LRAALKLDPGYVAVRQALLRQLLDARKFDEAMVVLQDGLENMPTQTGWAVSWLACSWNRAIWPVPTAPWRVRRAMPRRMPITPAFRAM
jgi:hypothetical protein